MDLILFVFLEFHSYVRSVKVLKLYLTLIPTTCLMYPASRQLNSRNIHLPTHLNFAASVYLHLRSPDIIFVRRSSESQLWFGTMLKCAYRARRSLSNWIYILPVNPLAPRTPTARYLNRTLINAVPHDIIFDALMDFWWWHERLMYKDWHVTKNIKLYMDTVYSALNDERDSFIRRFTLSVCETFNLTRISTSHRSPSL